MRIVGFNLGDRGTASEPATPAPWAYSLRERGSAGQAVLATPIEKQVKEPRPSDAFEKTIPQRTTAGLHEEEIPLAGYLLARKADRRPVEGADLELLRDAHDSIREARHLLRYGRGNVWEDVVRTHGLSLVATRLASKLESFLPPGAAQVVLGAGNCMEHAMLAAMSMSSRMSRDVKVRAAISHGLDHGWSEAARKGDYDDRAHTVVLDAWSTGPAVFAPDSEYGSAGKILTSPIIPGLERGEHFTRDSHGHLLDTAKAAAQTAREREIVPKLPASAPYVGPGLGYADYWETSSGVEPGFARRAAATMNREVTPKRAYYEADPSKRAHGRIEAKTTATIPAALRTQIQAVGIARELASEMTVRDRVEVAPKIANAARTLEVPGSTLHLRECL